MSSLDLGVIGNCQSAALIDNKATVVWCCLPQFDSDPVFCRLLRDDDEHELPGFYEIELVDFAHSEQHYLHNTCILVTELTDKHGGIVRITDFMPRYAHLGRTFRPVMLVRSLDPVAGRPRVRIRLRPATNYGAEACETTYGSNHIRYIGDQVTLRLTTDVALTHILEEASFILDRPRYLVLGPDESVREGPSDAFHQHFRATRDYWQAWARGLSIPFEWQQAVIRAAITLKLCTFEDTGAVVAATDNVDTGGGGDSGRNWDYRFCWLRDSYFVVQALNRLGVDQDDAGLPATTCMNIVAETEADGESMQPALRYYRPAPGMEEEIRIDSAVWLSRAWARSGAATRRGSRCRTTCTARSSCRRQHSRFSTIRLIRRRFGDRFRGCWRSCR